MSICEKRRIGVLEEVMNCVFLKAVGREMVVREGISICEWFVRGMLLRVTC